MGTDEQRVGPLPADLAGSASHPKGNKELLDDPKREATKSLLYW